MAQRDKIDEVAICMAESVIGKGNCQCVKMSLLMIVSEQFNTNHSDNHISPLPPTSVARAMDFDGLSAILMGSWRSTKNKFKFFRFHYKFNIYFLFMCCPMLVSDPKLPGAFQVELWFSLVV